MGKELVIAQVVLLNEDRERLRVENIQDLARFATMHFNGEFVPPDLRPLEQHLSTCELCRNDVTILTGALDSESQARLDFLDYEQADLSQRQAQEDWMWENR